MRAPANGLHRFSNRCWLDDSLNTGRFRLAPASGYLAIENDLARQDNERERELIYSRSSSRVHNISVGQEIPLLSDITHTTSIATDYYVLCFSLKNNDYLYDEFQGSDSILSITNFSEFESRFYRSADSVLPGWIVWGGAVTYGRPSPDGAFFQKPLRHFPQCEWRCVIIPPVATEELQPIFLDLGSLSAVAHISARTRPETSDPKHQEPNKS